MTLPAAGTTGATPQIDVILPAYNGRAVIGKALDSALAQEVPLRVIVVDDGSTDDTAAIARTYGPSVIVVSQANRGVSGARNTGLRLAEAPYVAFLDQDDVWKPGKIRRQLALIEAHPDVGLVFTDMRLQAFDGHVIEDGYLTATEPYARLARTPLGDDAWMLPETLAAAVVRFNFISPSTVVARRAALEAIGGFDEAFRLIDDADCWIRLLRDWRGIAIEDTLVLSIVWEGNASNKRDLLILERLKLAEKVNAQPKVFPGGTADYFSRERPISLYRLGILALNAGDSVKARKLLGDSLRAQPSLTTALAYLGATLPAPVCMSLLRLKRAVGLRWSIKVR